MPLSLEREREKPDSVRDHPVRHLPTHDTAPPVPPHCTRRMQPLFETEAAPVHHLNFSRPAFTPVEYSVLTTRVKTDNVKARVRVLRSGSTVTEGREQDRADQHCIVGVGVSNQSILSLAA